MSKVWEAILYGLNTVKVFVQKALTIVVDRRAWVVGLFVAALSVSGFLGLDKAVSDVILSAVGNTLTGVQELLVAVIAVIAALGKIAAAVYPVVKLIESWTQRPPSGDDFKRIVYH